MLFSLLPAMLLAAPQIDIAAIDKLVRARDVSGLSPYCVGTSAAEFFFLSRSGAYGVGERGWKAELLRLPRTGKEYVVITTDLTSQDYGDQVFPIEDGKIGHRVPESLTQGHRIRHHEFDIAFDLSKLEARIVDKVTLESSPNSDDVCWMRMSPCYKVTAARREDGKDIIFNQAGGVVALDLGKERPKQVILEYVGNPKMPMYAGSISKDEAQLTNDYWYPMIGRLPATYAAAITVPSGWHAIAQGELVSKTEGGSGVRYVYRMDMPAVYFSLSAGPYRVVKAEMDGREFWVASSTMSQTAMEIQSQLYADIFKFYDRLRPYPWKSFGALVTPRYGGGALEAYSFATYGGGLPGVDAHEPAHTWFGGMLPNTYLRSFWNESFAVYCSGLFEREGAPGVREDRRLAFVSDATPSAAYSGGRVASSGVDAGPVASALGYGKGADVLQMLEVEIGTEGMLNSMREWLRSHKTGEPAEWEDFEAAVARATKRDLGWFFDQWLRRPGWARFKIEKVRLLDGEIRGETVFTGDDYRLTLDVLLRTESGEMLHKRADITQRKVETGRYEFSIPVEDKVVRISFDPHRRMLREYTDDPPPSLRSELRSLRRFTDPKTSDWLQGVGGRALDKLPENLDGCLIVASPESLSVMRDFCGQIGFRVTGDLLEYHGVTINLNEGGALALVDLPIGGQCAIGLGKTLLRPDTGKARVAVFDKYGRFLAGETEPDWDGPLVFDLN